MRAGGPDRGMGRAKHPCLAARPTRDGRPYRRQLGQHAAAPTLDVVA